MLIARAPSIKTRKVYAESQSSGTVELLRRGTLADQGESAMYIPMRDSSAEQSISRMKMSDRRCLRRWQRQYRTLRYVVLHCKCNPFLICTMYILVFRTDRTWFVFGGY